MAVPGVNAEMLKELEDMGFPTARATRALHCSGNASTGAAIDWLIDHENDPNIDEVPRVSVDLDIESPEPSFVTEEMKTKAEQLTNGALKNRRNEKNLEREREKKRIRAGKELLQAKRVVEENERKRLLASRKAEKEEEKQARERILQKLKNDQLERQQRLGISAESSTSLKHKLPITKNKTLQDASTYQVAKAEKMRECLRSIRRSHKGDEAKVRRAFQTLLTYIGNVARKPEVEKFRRIRLSNPVFQERVGTLEGGIEFLELCGFEKTEGAEFLVLPGDKIDMGVLHTAGTQLKSALTNPYFGLLSI